MLRVLYLKRFPYRRVRGWVACSGDFCSDHDLFPQTWSSQRSKSNHLNAFFNLLLPPHFKFPHIHPDRATESTACWLMEFRAALGDGVREYLYPGNYSVRGHRGPPWLHIRPVMDSTVTDVESERGRKWARAHSLLSPIVTAERMGRLWAGKVGWAMGRYICKMDYVGFAEFNIDTDSS